MKKKKPSESTKSRPVSEDKEEKTKKDYIKKPITPGDKPGEPDPNDALFKEIMRII